MQEGSITFRAARAGAAAGAAMLRASVLLLVVLVVGLPLVRIAADWYVRGRVDLSPVQALPPDPRVRQLVVSGGTTAESAAVRRAVGGLRYRIDPRAVSFVIVDENPFSSGIAAEYLPYLDIIRIQRVVVDAGGPMLRWTVAHEIGHYVDQTYMTAESRQRFRRLRRIPAPLTWESPSTPWERRPVEDFGEVFAVIAQTSVFSAPGTAYGPVRDPGAFESLLAGVGVELGRRPPARSWREILARQFALAFETVTDPSLERPLGILVAAYLLVSAAGPAMRAWRRHPDAEGVPLDREPGRVLNTSRRLPHTTGRQYVTHQDRDHGSRG